MKLYVLKWNQIKIKTGDKPFFWEIDGSLDYWIFNFYIYLKIFCYNLVWFQFKAIYQTMNWFQKFFARNPIIIFFCIYVLINDYEFYLFSSLLNYLLFSFSSLVSLFLYKSSEKSPIKQISINWVDINIDVDIVLKKNHIIRSIDTWVLSEFFLFSQYL